jgi:leucyl/phenylalanyl-tRNA--protein transferase
MMRKLLWIDPHDPLPPTDQALTLEEGANGLLAAGSDLSAQRLLEAYGRGIFPWFSQGEPVLWWSPAPRMVLMIDEFKLAKSLRKTIRASLEEAELNVECDRDFSTIMAACAEPRPGQAGTWISPVMIRAYGELHAMGLAHSIEIRRSGRLVGGLYCVSMGKMVFGESMFSREPDASKLALATLVAWLKLQGAQMIDCQQRTEHLVSLGGREIERSLFEHTIRQLRDQPAMPWHDAPPAKHHLQQWLAGSPFQGGTGSWPI